MATQDHPTHAPIIAAFSPETGARGPVDFGLAASRLTGAPLVIVVVADTGSLPVHFGANTAPELPAGIAQTVRHLELDLREQDVYVEVRPFEDSTAARGLARAIDELKPELVVLGSTTRGRKGSAMLGTTAERVIHVSACPVAVVPHGYERPEGGVKLVGVAYTGTAEGEDALQAAARLVRTRSGAKLRVITVIDPKYAQEEAHGLMAEQHHEVGTESGTAARARTETEAKMLASIAQLGDIEAEPDVLVNEASAGLIAASAHVDMLVMGSRGLGQRRAVVLGSVSRRVIDRAACPVLVIPRGSAEKSDQLLSDAAGAQSPG